MRRKDKVRHTQERMIPEKIRQNFNRAAHAYDKFSGVQNTVCDLAIQVLAPYAQHFDTVADFACGTGGSTQKLRQHIPFRHCYAVDFSEKPLAIAKHKLEQDQHIVFVHGNIARPLFQGSCLDLIFCNMGLQWVQNLSQSLALFHHYLSHMGALLFTLPVVGNFPEMKPGYKHRLHTHEAIVRMLHDSAFHVIKSGVCAFSYQFSDQLTLLRSLKSVGATYHARQGAYPARGLSKHRIQDRFVNQDNTQLTYLIGVYFSVSTSVSNLLGWVGPKAG